jgi:hypothetical protein
MSPKLLAAAPIATARPTLDNVERVSAKRTSTDPDTPARAPISTCTGVETVNIAIPARVLRTTSIRTAAE